MQLPTREQYNTQQDQSYYDIEYKALNKDCLIAYDQDPDIDLVVSANHNQLFALDHKNRTSIILCLPFEDKPTPADRFKTITHLIQTCYQKNNTAHTDTKLHKLSQPIHVVDYFDNRLAGIVTLKSGHRALIQDQDFKDITDVNA